MRNESEKKKKYQQFKWAFSSKQVVRPRALGMNNAMMSMLIKILQLIDRLLLSPFAV